MTDTIAMPDQTEEVVEGCELVDFMTRRARTYGLLARIFRVEVDGKFLEELRHLKFPTSTGNEHVDYGYRTMYNYLKGTWEDTLLDLARDYARTFIGHGNNGRSAAYPFESVHTSEKRLLMQDARDAVLAAYRSEMITLVNEHNEPEDHMGFELAFSAVLLRRAVEALAAGNTARAIELVEKERAFVRDHLGVWAPEFASDVKRIAQTGFYRALADILLGYLEVDTATMEAVAAELGE